MKKYFFMLGLSFIAALPLSASVKGDASPHSPGPIFFYKVELADVHETESSKVIRINIPDLISGVTCTYNKITEILKRCTWSGTRGIMDLTISNSSDLAHGFPDSLSPSGITMIGISRPKDYINQGKWYFEGVVFHGFINVYDPKSLTNKL